jgi:protein transport protein SEC61 subunit alpha
MFSFQRRRFERGLEYHGAFIACVDLFIRRKDKFRALSEAMFRSHLPNLANVFSTGLIFLAIVVLERVKVSIGLVNNLNRMPTKPLKLRLFYSSTMPIILQHTIIGQISSFSQMMCSNWPDALVTKFLGAWRSLETGLGMDFHVPIGGLCYYLQAPRSFAQTLSDPVHTCVYLAICLVSAGVIAYYYANIGGESSEDIAKWLHSNHVMFRGHRSEDWMAIKKRLGTTIPVISALGGVLTGLLSFIADFLGAFGSGTGILIATSTVSKGVKKIKKEYAKIGRTLRF